MPDQVVPITQLDRLGVILDTPPVSLPPNAFTNARNVRFKDGAVRKMEGEVDIFEGMAGFFENADIGQVQYIAWWPSPNQTTRDAGYYVFVVENLSDPNSIVHDVYAMLPGATANNNIHRIGSGFSTQGKWQHTLFNGGFTFIINNGIERPQYVTEQEGEIDITLLSLADLPGWDSYQVNELLLSDTFTDTSSTVFDTGQTREEGITRYIITRTRATVDNILIEGTDYTVTQENNQDVITFIDTALMENDRVQVNFQSVNPVNVRAAIVRAFGDFLVAGNLVERDSLDDSIIRRLTGVVRSSDVAQPGSIPANWNPFAVGVSTADEFVIADTGTVQDMVPLQGSMYLYTNTSISVMRLTGNTSIPLAVQPVTDQYGTLTTDAVIEYDGKHFVIGSDDIYLFGGHPGSIQSVSDTKVRRAFFQRVNPINDNLINLFTLRYAARDEIWICFPTVDSVRGEADEAYIWNYRNNTWTIRTLNSVIRGDIGPVPGGGIPSAIISFNGQGGTDDVIRAGSREVQTIDVPTSSSVGHAEGASRPTQFNFRTRRATADPTPIPRGMLELDAPELVEYTIGPDFYSGPNPAMQQYNIINIPDLMIGAFASGGARFRIEYTTATANTGNDNTMITVHANELSLPGTGDRLVTGADYASVLAAHLDGLEEFQDWTITSNSNTINLLSDFAGRRELRGLELITFTSTVENLIPDPNMFTGEGPHVFNDSFGDELFTVSRSGEEAPFTFNVTTSRDTGFDGSDGITQLAFVTDNTTFAAPDPFNRDSGLFTFQSMSGEFALRTQPPANFINLVEETDRIPNNGEITDTTTEDGVTIERRQVQGGYTRESINAPDPRDDTNEGVTVTIADTTSMASTNTAVIGNSGDVVDSGGFNIGTANQLTFTNTVSYASPRAYRTSDRTFLNSNCPPSVNFCTSSQGVTGWPRRPDDSILLDDWNHPSGTGDKTIITSWDTGASVPNPAQSGEFIQIIYGGFGIEYANGVRLFYATSSTRPSGNEFIGFSNQGANRLAGATISTHTGNVRVIIGGDESVTVPGREFTATNNSPFGITFNYQGGGANSITVPAGESRTVTGAAGSTNEAWTWANQPISLSGTSIGGSGTQDLRGTNGRRETIANGVTVVSQNTSSPQTTTQGTAPQQGLLMPSNNGGSISNPATASFTPTQNFYGVFWGNNNNATTLSVYDLSTGNRITGGGGGNVGNNPPGGWDNGFESGSFPAPPQITASNITNPVAMGAVSHSVLRGVLNSNSQETVCTALQPAVATSNFGSNGIRQAGTGPFTGPSIGIQGRRGRAGYGWTVPSTGRSNECSGNLNAGVSFAGDFRVYAQNGNGSAFATNVRFILTGPQVTTTVTVPRAPSETYTVTNSNPFPITFSAGSINGSVAADSTVTFSANQEGVAWSVSTPVTTNYQYILTNNNQRPLISGTLTHDASSVDLAGLGVGESISTGFSTVQTASATFVRQIEQAGASTVVTPANLITIEDGVGTVPTDPADLEAVRYRFRVNFTDDSEDIDVTYQTPENRDPNDPDNLKNNEAVEAFAATLRDDTNFSTYFRVITNVEDSEVPVDSFRIEALAAPGNLIEGTTIVMPPHDAIALIVEVDQQNGGDADISAMSIQRGVSTDNEPITITIESSDNNLDEETGEPVPVRIDTHFITLNGSFPAAPADDNEVDVGGRAITEVVRDHLRLDPSFDNIWGAIQTDEDNLDFTSDDNGPFTIRTLSVSPEGSGILPEHLLFTETERGVVAPDVVTYPAVTIEGPIGELIAPFDITLEPTDPTSTDRLNNNDIAEIIRAGITAQGIEGWTVISGADANIGTSVGSNQIRIVRDEAAEVVSGLNQTEGWRVTNVTYGNTGATLPGERDPDNDGDVIGRLNPLDFMRANTAGRVLGTNPLATLLGTGDDYDFRGSRTERSQRTRIMVQITNPSITSLDPVMGNDGLVMRDEDGVLATVEGNTQYIPITVPGGGDYNPVTQSGSQPGDRTSTDDIVTQVQSRITAVNRRVQVTRNGNELSIIPSQFSELANFVVAVFINDSTANVDRWNAIVEANAPVFDSDVNLISGQAALANQMIDTRDNDGIQSTVPPSVSSGPNSQVQPDNIRVPNFSDDTNVRNTGDDPDPGLVTADAIINEEFDALRPWPTTQVNLNREYPIFCTTIVNDNGTIANQHFRGADLGFLNLTEPYESFVERIELALTPEFDTEQIQALALWGDGGNAITFGQPIDQAVLNVKMYGTDNPGSTLGAFNFNIENTTNNDFVIGDNYKIDMRIHGRFLNLRITDTIPEREGQVLPMKGISWNVSGMQADIFKGGRR